MTDLHEEMKGYRKRERVHYSFPLSFPMALGPATSIVSGAGSNPRAFVPAALPARFVGGALSVWLIALSTAPQLPQLFRSNWKTG